MLAVTHYVLQKEGKPSPKTSKKKRSAKPVKVSTSLSLASDEAEDEKVVRINGSRSHIY